MWFRQVSFLPSPLHFFEGAGSVSQQEEEEEEEKKKKCTFVLSMVAYHDSLFPLNPRCLQKNNFKNRFKYQNLTPSLMSIVRCPGVRKYSARSGELLTLISLV
jgi:hypothetical protein